MTAPAADVRRVFADVPRVAGIGALTLALLAGPVVGGVVTSVRVVIAALLVATLTDVFGRAVTPWLRLPATAPRWLTSVVVGYAAASAVHLGATALLNLAAWAALAVDVVVAALLAWTARRWPPERDVASAPDASALPARLQVAALLACAALAVLWGRETIRAVPTAEAGAIFPAWQDYFLHGAEVSYLRDYPSYGRHSQYLSAVPNPLYHRGSFALAAAFSAVGGTPSLATATAYWLPAGLLLTMCATMAWGATMGGPFAAIGAVVAVFLVPDASHYGAANHYLSFEWLMQMASGSGYAVPLAVTALTVLVSAPPSRQTHAFVAAGALVGLSALFRVHVALLASAMLGWLALLTWRPRLTRAGVSGAVALGVATLAALAWMESVSLAPHFLTGASNPVLFFVSVHTQANALPSVFVEWWQTHGAMANVAAGFALMLWAGLGVWVVAWPVVATTGVMRRLGRHAGLVPVALLLGSLTVVLVVPTPAHGDITDFGHRPFVLVYLVVAGLTGGAVARLGAEWSQRRSGSLDAAAVIAGAVAAAGVFVPWMAGARVQQRWVPQYATMSVPRDALRAGDYIRAHAGAGDQILAASEDHYAVYVAVGERPAYLSRTSLFQQLGPATADAATARQRAHLALGATPTFEALQAFGRREGVSWYIADMPLTHQWSETTVDRCAFCGDQLRVYDLR